MQSYSRTTELSTPPVDRWFNLLLMAGRGPKWHGRYYTARCPVHDDRQASLMHTRGYDVPICLAGCESHELRRWAGDGLGHVPPTPVYIEPTRPAWKDNPKPNLPPLHADDALEYLQQIATKTGRIEYAHPDGRRATHFRDWNKKVRNPGMTEAGWYPRLMLPDDPGAAVAIVIAEGEKDAARACLMGFISAASPGGGARGKAATWTDVISHAAGMPLPVVIIPDNDKTGRKFGNEVKRIIRDACVVCYVADPADANPGDCILDLPDGSERIKALVELGDDQTDHLSAFEQGVSQGFTDGRPALDGGILWLKGNPADEKSGVSALGNKPLYGKSAFLGQRPPRPKELYCQNQAKRGSLHRMPNMGWKFYPFDCNRCTGCVLWSVSLIADRYARDRGTIQTVLIVSGFHRADEASEWSKKQAQRVSRHHRSDVPRCRLIIQTQDYKYRLVVVYDEGLPDRVIELTERAAKRSGLDCSVEITSLSRAAFSQMVPLARSIYNDLRGDEESGRTNTCHFSHWRDWAPRDVDFLLDDGMPVEPGDTLPEIEEMSSWEKRRMKMPLEERATANVNDWLAGIELSHDGLMALRARRLAGGRGTQQEVAACIASGDWRGPTALLKDLADAMDDDGDVSIDARECIRVASAYIVGGEL